MMDGGGWISFSKHKGANRLFDVIRVRGSSNHQSSLGVSSQGFLLAKLALARK